MFASTRERAILDHAALINVSTTSLLRTWRLMLLGTFLLQIALARVDGSAWEAHLLCSVLPHVELLEHLCVCNGLLCVTVAATAAIFVAAAALHTASCTRWHTLHSIHARLYA